MAIAKAAVAVVGVVGLATATGIALVSSNPVPVISVKESGEFTDSTKFAGFYSYYFLSVKDKDNEELWKVRDAIAKKNAKTDTGYYFTELKGNGTANHNVKDKCKTKYSETNFTTTSDKDKWKEVWEFCSIGGNRPTTVSEISNLTGENAESGIDKEKAYLDSSSSSKLGGTLKEKVVSTYDKRNNWFWERRNAEFETGGKFGATTDSTYFKKTDGKTLKDLCRAAYKVASTGQPTPSPTSEDTERYCGLEKKT